MTSFSIYLIDNNTERSNMLSYILKLKGYNIAKASTINETLSTKTFPRNDLTLINMGSSSNLGIELCKMIKTSQSNTPIICLTKSLSEEEVLNTYKSGASECLSGPLSIDILLLKISFYLSTQNNEKKEVKNDLKAAPEKNENLIQKGPFELHLTKHQFKINGREVYLTLQEFKIMNIFMKYPTWVLTREQIIQYAHGGEYMASDRVIDVQISHLRKKISPYESCIKTVRGIGYLFETGKEKIHKQSEFDFTQ